MIYLGSKDITLDILRNFIGRNKHKIKKKKTTSEAAKRV